jgi:hypothetical protein
MYALSQLWRRAAQLLGAAAQFQNREEETGLLLFSHGSFSAGDDRAKLLGDQLCVISRNYFVRAAFADDGSLRVSCVRCSLHFPRILIG